MISSKYIDTIRSIAQAGDNYDEIKRLLAPTGWEITEDERRLGYLKLFIPDATDKCYRLIICYRDPQRPPYSIFSFFIFEDKAEKIAAFNAAFQSTADFLAKHFGTPGAVGNRQPSHRPWSYSYKRWSLPEGEYTLVQSEFDITEGLDITLWIQPVGTPI